MEISWKPLGPQRSADVPLPPLLISKSFKANSYTIHLTDLNYIWSESLNHAAILERAEAENTSIDPSDGSQLRILLDKLALALSSGPDTTLSLHIPSSPGRARPTISLHLTIKLPGSLAPLEWPIHLSAAPQSVLTSQLTVPLLQAENAHIQEMEGLTEVLKEKDHVIQKLLDRLETVGTDLGQVFPQATARVGRKVDRKQAEDKVRGLAPFDIEAWSKGLGGEQPQDITQLLESVFAEKSHLSLGAEKNVGADNWWEAIKGSTVDLLNGKPSTRSKTPSKPTLKHNESTETNDDFQVQATPPHLTSKAPKSSQSVTLDSSTDDEDLDVPSQACQPPKPVKKIGKIGGNKESPKKPSPTSDASTDDERVSTSRPAKKFGRIGGKKEPLLANSDSTVDEEAPAPKTTPVKKFGNTGGKKAIPPPTDDDSTGDEPILPKSAQKFGKIGGRQETPEKQAEDDSTNDDEPKPAKKVGKIVSKKEAPPPPVAADETTDDDGPPPRQRASSTSSPEPAPKPKRGLGRIGSKKARSPSASPPPTDKPKKKGKLGQIGGKKESTPTPPSLQQEETPAKRKLGAIGGRKKVDEDGPASGVEEVDKIRGRPVKAEKEKTTPPRETSEERAERKRRELKRELEEKVKAPAKKKRKF